MSRVTSSKSVYESLSDSDVEQRGFREVDDIDGRMAYSHTYKTQRSMKSTKTNL